jgi:hypothetical protein
LRLPDGRAVENNVIDRSIPDTKKQKNDYSPISEMDHFQKTAKRT